MKFKGNSFVQYNREIVPIYRDSLDEEGRPIYETDPETKHDRKVVDTYEFVVTPLPSGWNRRMRRIGISVYPAAPETAVKVEGRLVKGADGKIVTKEDYDDPDYQRKCTTINERMRALKLACVLRDDKNVEWEAQEPTGADAGKLEAWVKYADALIEELSPDRCSLTDDEIDHFIEVAQKLSNSANIEEATKDFLEL